MKSAFGRFRAQARWLAAGATLLVLFFSLGVPPSLLAQGAGLTLTFAPGRDATQPGSVALTPQGNQTVVVLNMAPNPAGNGADELAHIHQGGCPGVGAVQYPLTNVVNGRSTTTVNASLSSIMDGSHSINVHRGTAAPESNIYTACVDIPAGGGGAAGAARPAVQAPPKGPVTVQGPARAGAAPAPAAAAPARAAAPVAAAPARLPSTGTGGLLSDEQSAFGRTSIAVLLASLMLLVTAGALAVTSRRA
jgi:hypothetical protein